MAKKKKSSASTRVKLQSDILKQAAGITSEIATLNAEQAATAAETARMEETAATDIAFQEAIQQNVADLAAGKISAIGPGGPVALSAGGTPALTPEQQFKKAQETAQRTDAFQTIVNAFKTYGIEGIADTVFSLMADPTIGENQAIYKMKYDTSINPNTGRPWNEAYSKRFAANAERIKAGKPALSEGEYLTAERSYARALQGLGVSRLATRTNFDKFIAGDVSVDEVVDRVTTAVNRIQNAPKETKDALAQFYPNLSILDVAEAVLDPEISLPALKRQVATAEIGAGAIRAGLGVSRQRAEELQALGVTQQQALAGFQQVAEIAPRGGQLAAIYKESPYTQQTAEAEIFATAGSQEARQQRERLTKKEQAAFSGRTGAFQGALARDRAGAI